MHGSKSFCMYLCMAQYHTQCICGWRLPCTPSFLSWCTLHQIDPHELAYDASTYDDHFPKEIRDLSFVFVVTYPYPFCKKEEEQWAITLESPTFDAIRGLPENVLDAMSTWIQQDVQKNYFDESGKVLDPPRCYAVLSIA